MPCPTTCNGTTSKSRCTQCLTLCLAGFLLAAGCGPAANEGAWNQWGGPNRDFSVADAQVAPAWPEDGPKKLWSRDLGDGFSTIVTDGATLYTMYRGEDGQESIVALSAANGDTRWEHKYPAPYIEVETDVIDMETGKKKTEPQVTKFGTGPNSTPLLVHGRLYTIGFTGIMHCLDARSGKPLWSHDLYKDLGATYQMFGWATSPIAYGNNVIVLTGGKGHGITAFDQTTGKVAWQATDYASSYSSPILVNVDGEDHLVAYMSTHVLGLCPKTGMLHWSLEHKNQFGSSIATPLWCPNNRLFFVNGGDTAGGRVVKLAKATDGKIGATDMWTNKKVRGGLSNPVRIGEYIYGPNSGGENVKLISAVKIEDGEVAWQERGVPGPKCLNLGERLIVLDDEGHLMLVDANPEGMKVLCKHKLLGEPAWTAPTLVGSRLYLRDRKTIMAVDLS